jgi:tRNA 2-thiouridine synthesizing protein A
MQRIRADRTLDTIGLYCPVPVLRAREEIDKLAVGQILEIDADDPAAEEDLKRFAKRLGHEVLSVESSGNSVRVFLRKVK